MTRDLTGYVRSGIRNIGGEEQNVEVDYDHVEDINENNGSGLPVGIDTVYGLDTTYLHLETPQDEALPNPHDILVHDLNTIKEKAKDAHGPTKTNPNASGSWNAVGYLNTAAMTTFMLVDEKQRGNSVITNYGPGTLWLSPLPPVGAGTPGQVRVPVNGTRTIRTAKRIWAIFDGAAPSSCDVAEEFGG